MTYITYQASIPWPRHSYRRTNNNSIVITVKIHHPRGFVVSLKGLQLVGDNVMILLFSSYVEMWLDFMIASCPLQVNEMLPVGGH